MVDVDRRFTSHAHIAGLRRLSARASNGPPLPPSSFSSSSPRTDCFSFTPLARTVIHHLRQCHVQIAPGLTDEEFSRIEAPFAFSFPPDLRAILQEGLPLGAGFPDWRSGGLKQLRLTLSLPIAGLCYEVARGRFWCKPWGTRPSDTQEAVNIARAALRRVPILIPVYRYCYIPASPNLAGNPVFFVCQKDIFYCGHDLGKFFEREDFVSCDDQLPSDFASLDGIHGRGTSLGGRGDWVWENGRSFRLEKVLNLPRQQEDVSRRKVGQEAELGESQCEDQSRDLEAWGRNVDALAKRYDASSRNATDLPRRSFEVFISYPVLKRYDHPPGSLSNRNKVAKRHLSSDSRADDRFGSTKAAATTTTNSSRMFRRIEFWSEYAEKRHFTAADQLFSCVKVDVDLGKASSEKQKQQELAGNKRAPPYWLERYLDMMAAMLREGGWKEGDVTEMINVVAPLAEPSLCIDQQSILEGLVLYVNFLSDALRRAGWSAPDVAEALDVDLSFPDNRKRPSTLPPHVAARAGKLVQCIAQF